MTSTIQVLAGPAGSGKTARMLQRYRTFLAESAGRMEIGRALWLTPTQHSASHLRENLLTDQLAGCFNPQIFTFAGFAERILRDCPERIEPLSVLQQRVLVRLIVENLLGENRLQHFGPVAGTAGFIDQMLGLISELKRGEIWPEHFEEALHKDRPRDLELAAVYRDYQNHLHQRNLYDGEGRFWSARDQLTRGHWGAFAEISLVIVDGFTDFTRTQYEILQLLAERADHMLLTLPLEQPLKRTDLFAKSVEALAQLESRVTVQIEHQTATADQLADHPPAFGWIAEKLFDNPREVSPSTNGDGVELLAMTGQQGEVRAIAFEVKQLLLAGISPDEIVVAFRSPSDYADLVEEVFTESGIPFICRTETSLAAAPVLKALTGVLRAEAEDWPFRQLLSCLDNNYFQPDWPEYAAGEAVRDVAAGLRRLKLRSGRRATLSQLEKESQREISSDDVSASRLAKRQEQIRAYDAALKFLTRLSNVLQPLRSRRTLMSWAETVVSLARELRFDPRTLPSVSSDRDRRFRESDIAAWRVFEDSLFSAATLDDQFPGPQRKLDLPQFLSELTDLLHKTSYSVQGTAHGTVQILDATQVRNLDVAYLFLGGLTETGFPARRGDDCFFSEIQRQEFNGRGVALRHRTSHTQDEMMLYYGVVTRARRRLTLSYPAMHMNGQPLLPSPYLLSLEDLFTDGAISKRHEFDLDPVPNATGMLTDEDLRVVALDQCLHKQPGLLRSLFARPQLESVGRNLLAAVDAANFRFRTHGFTGYEGLIETQQSRQRLQRRFSTEHQFSATELEHYANCPFKFFLSSVLDIQPLDSPEIETDYRLRGIVTHKVLTRLHREFSAAREADTAGSELPSGEELSARFEELLREEQKRSADIPELQKVLAEIEERLLAEWGAEYGNQWSAFSQKAATGWDAPPVPELFEIAFGAAPGDETDAPSETEHDCLKMGVAHRTVRVRGRIDRIDVGKIAGRTAFNVVDYKTGNSTGHTKNSVLDAKLIQLSLYALAVQRLGLVAEDALPFQLGYWFIKETGFKKILDTGSVSGDSLEEHADWQELQEKLEAYIPQLAADIRQGNFPVYNTDPNCTSRCEYSKTCRVGQIRSLEESLHKTWEIGKSVSGQESESQA